MTDERTAAPAAPAPSAPAPTRRPTSRDAGRVRAVVDAVLPIVDAGRFAVKRVVGQPLEVTVHAFADGHDAVRTLLCWRAEGAKAFETIEMRLAGNDVWHASFAPSEPGRYVYTAVAWVDHFESWRRDLLRRVDEADIRLAARAGAVLADAAGSRARGEHRTALKQWAKALAAQAAETEIDALKALALDQPLAEIAALYPDRRFEARYEVELPLVVDRVRAGFSSWYEMFPRSAAPDASRHGTFDDVIQRLPYIATLGFDVLYLPPIHPIGRERRKGRNNAVEAQPGDLGSPWAIGAAEGGHTAILPELGSAEDFRRLVAEAATHGIEIALDIAFQCAPDHPWVAQHPDWFAHRPDGSVQYAENPPKKYQDIYPFDFESEDWRALWSALKGVFDHWIGQGVNIFRVDNPHTKAFGFWEWAIGEIKRAHPQVLFLAEAFTRPKVMHRLAKLGFSQSYTYFTWRQTRAELTAYFTELTQGPGASYFRPNAWPNTPDILNEQLHHAPPSVFKTRLLLAATLTGNYGIYGPAFELMDGTPRAAGTEDYLDSEKYQTRAWDVATELTRPDSLASFIASVNRARRAHPALQAQGSLRFLETGNDQLIAYERRSADGLDVLIAIVNLDPHNPQSGWVQIDPWWPSAAGAAAYAVDDLLTGQRFVWHGSHSYVMLDPAVMPAHLLHVRSATE